MEVKILVILDDTGIEITIEEARKLYTTLGNLFSFRFPVEEVESTLFNDDFIIS